MKRRFSSVLRASLSLGCAGVLFQATGCMVGTNELIAGLANSVVTSLISSLVFGAFNVVP